LIKLKPWKIGISRRVRRPVYFGLSYVKGWLDTHWLLNGWEAGYVYAPYIPVIAKDVTQMVDAMLK